jgi:hypothetical protein
MVILLFGDILEFNSVLSNWLQQNLYVLYYVSILNIVQFSFKEGAT